MEPKPDAPRVRTSKDGRFSFEVPDFVSVVLAMDQSRSLGGWVVLPGGSGQADLEIHISRLVRVAGTLEGPDAGRRPVWSGVIAKAPLDPMRPLAWRTLVACGSFEARFAMSLPPGRYTLHAYTDGRREKDSVFAESIPDQEIVLDGKAANVNLGVIHLSTVRRRISSPIELAKAGDSWQGSTPHLGERAPEWHAVDAWGVNKGAKVSDFRGKWVLLDFWSIDCHGCLSHGLPKLARFYREHANQRSQFEIISICVDDEGRLKSISDLDKQLQPIVDHVWGKPLPFPILLDPSLTTWNRYWQPPFGSVILIDPEGKVAPGDDTALAQKLNSAKVPRTK
jgi:hypothetical protein